MRNASPVAVVRGENNDELEETIEGSDLKVIIDWNFDLVLGMRSK